jgi:hypothetical protein
MPDRPERGNPPVLAADEVARLVLTVLLDRHPALVALEELVRHFDYPRPEDTIPEVFIRESVDELRRCGLAHRLDQFAFATYSAVRGNELAT